MAFSTNIISVTCCLRQKRKENLQKHTVSYEAASFRCPHPPTPLRRSLSYSLQRTEVCYIPTQHHLFTPSSLTHSLVRSVTFSLFIPYLLAILLTPSSFLTHSLTPTLTHSQCYSSTRTFIKDIFMNYMNCSSSDGGPNTELVAVQMGSKVTRCQQWSDSSHRQ